MAKDLCQNTKRNKKTDSNERGRRNKKRGNRIIGIAALSLLLAACGAPSERAEEAQNTETKEEPKEWAEEYYSCEVQELSGYLYEHTPASPYASAEIMIKDYKGERLETEWDEPSAFRFAGEADVVWRFYNSLAEMEAALNEAAMQEMDGNSLHFLYYTFPMTENDHALDLYHVLKRKFDTNEQPLTAWSADNGKLFYYIQETLNEVDGYEFSCLNSRSSKVNLYVKDRTAYGLTLLNAPSKGDDETLEYMFDDVFQHYGILGSGWGLDEENLYWIDHDERLTELENPKRSFLEVRGIDENWESAGDEGIMRYFGLLVEADYELPLTENGRMLSLHFSLAKEDEEKTPVLSIEEEEIPFDIPENWRWVRLKNICTKIVDGDHNPPRGTLEKTEYLMLSAQNINFDKLVDLDQVRYLTKEIFEQENLRTQVQTGDIFFTIVGTLGRSCIYTGGYNISFQRSVAVISTKIYNRYLKCVLDSPYIQQYMVTKATGTAQKGFYLNQVDNLLIPIPSFEEQRRIVERLDTLLPMCEDLKEG